MSYQQIKLFAQKMRQNPTPAEHIFWQNVRNRKFMGLKFYRQYIIQYSENKGYKSFFISDFYCHTGRLVVELDGEIHLNEKQIEYDQIREDILKDMGFNIMRFNNEQVLNDWMQVKKALKLFFENQT